MNDLQVIKGVKCYEDENGIIQLQLESVCWGLGFTKVENKKGKEYASVRWDRVFNYLTDIGFVHKGAKDIFIPEPIFYLLAMKAESEKAKAFQKVVAYEILPTIRKHGMYVTPKLSKELQAIFVLDEKQQQLEKKVCDLENNIPLFNIECEELQNVVKRKGVKILGGKESKAYKDKSLRTKLYSDIQKEIKRQFGLHSYKALKRSHLKIAIEIVEKYSTPLILQDKINLLNNQIKFDNAI
ncbi:MAG: ORF6C domain-containing protein [Bacillota bacterium]|nr:ORF6C domain-containing protein [Bacillota bacterium]